MGPAPDGVGYDVVPPPHAVTDALAAPVRRARPTGAAFFDSVRGTPVSTIVAPAGCGKTATAPGLVRARA